MNSMAPVNSSRTFHIPSLDGIRALAFLIVFVSHDGLKPVPGLFGVAIFFFLSGYLITTLLRMEIETTGSFSVGHFYLRRAFRILPPFYLTIVLILGIVKAGWLQGNYSEADMAATALYVTNFWNIYVHPIMMPGFNIFWSLSVEEHFYLIFPFLMLIMLRFKWRRVTQASLLVGLCVAVLIWRLILVYHLHSLDMTFGQVTDPLRTMYGTDTRVDSILFGCVLALWGNPVLDYAASDRQAKHRWLPTFAAIAVLIFTFVYRSPAFRETVRYTLQAIAFIPLFSSAIRLHDHWAFRWLNSRIMRFIGLLSYTLYLVHYPIMLLVERWSANSVVVGVLALALSMAVAWVVHVLVEKPFARLRRRLGSRTTESIEPSSVELTAVG